MLYPCATSKVNTEAGEIQSRQLPSLVGLHGGRRLIDSLRAGTCCCRTGVVLSAMLYPDATSKVREMRYRGWGDLEPATVSPY
ncbi:hypothetical protein AVEN_57223-1 [Araneus ventricosus]|uniref:Uncharacterized protein n=1 Tax=Araneus ventricosus TaxID=182803 RepID=A0A4Y2JEV1_ARAVE|nr:hypothetical protein AVEN_57223-1 [Araneus ventricosus]